MMSDTSGPGTSHSIELAQLLDQTTYELEIHSNVSTHLTTATTTTTEATEGDVVWAGRADTLGWERGSNWEGFQQPVNPTTGIVTFGDAGAAADDSVTNVLDTDRTIGGLVFLQEEANHKTDLAGHLLKVEGIADLGTNLLTGTTAFSDGSLQIGTLAAPSDLVVGYATNWDQPSSSGSLILSNVTFEPYVSICRVGEGHMHSAEIATGVLDLTQAVIKNGLFKTNELRVGLGTRGNGAVNFSAASGLTDLVVTGKLLVGLDRGLIGRIGDPANDYALPPNVNITLGESEGARCDVTMGGPTIYWDSASDGKLVASSGGTCTAYVGVMSLGNHQGGAESWAGAGSGVGVLDLRAMDSITMDATVINLCADPPVTVNGHNDGRGYLYLPAGTVTAENVIVAHPEVNDTNADLTAEGVLELNGTVFTVSTSLAIGPRGTATTNVKGASCGIDLLATADFNLLGNLSIVFEQDQDPGETGKYWGLRCQGDHKTELAGLGRRHAQRDHRPGRHCCGPHVDQRRQHSVHAKAAMVLGCKLAGRAAAGRRHHRHVDLPRSGRGRR